MATDTRSQSENKTQVLKTIINSLPPERIDQLLTFARRLEIQSGGDTNSTAIKPTDAPIPFEASEEEIREEAAFRQLHPELRKLYPDQFVAIYGGELVDHDEDFATLNKRIRDTFGHKFVWIAPVLEQPEETWSVLSPRLS